jgi:hypothetical protein
LPSEPVDPNRPGDAIHPCSELAVRSECVSILEHPQKNVLDEVLTRRRVAAKAVEKIEQALVMPVKENAELFRIAALCGQHQGFVALLHRVSESEDWKWRRRLQGIRGT